MQYLLTEKEHAALVRAPADVREELEGSLLKVCSMVAEATPRNEHGWKGCVANRTTEYCDLCPVEEECPYQHKNWSK